MEKLLNRSDPERLDPERLPRAAQIGLTPSGSPSGSIGLTPSGSTIADQDDH